ncbi:MAG: RNA-binding cell elongation regulator Jag/EloR [Lawsonibacter sp.]|jgi:spoIIIJ-associated protein
MTKWIETTGRSEEDAIAAALIQLGLERDDVSIEVLERAKSGFLGFGGNPAKVRVSYEVNEEDGVPQPRKDLMEEELHTDSSVATASLKLETEMEETSSEPEQVPTFVEEETILSAKPGWQAARPQQPVRGERREATFQKATQQLQEGDEVLIGAHSTPGSVDNTLSPVSPEDEKGVKIRTFLTGLLERLDVQAEPELYMNAEGNYKVVLQGKGLGAIIGRRGETLDAIQQLTNYSVNHGQSKRVRVHIDAEGYRAKREESLQRLALKMAGKVVKYHKNMTLEAMNAYERHVIHTTLQDYPNVTTYSTGVEPNRRTVVAYAPGQK